MIKALGWGFVLGLSLSLGLACSSNSSGGTGGGDGAGGGGTTNGGTGGGMAVFGADGGHLYAPSYRPCLSNMECSAFESCSASYYYQQYSYLQGICTRACLDDTDCLGDVCRPSFPSQYLAPNGYYAKVCQKRCTGNPSCRGGQICGDAGVCEVYFANQGQSPECAQYVSCYEKTGGTIGSLDSSYGPQGTCWTTSMAAAASCTSACKSAIQSLKSAYPDAGC